VLLRGKKRDETSNNGSATSTVVDSDQDVIDLTLGASAHHQSVDNPLLGAMRDFGTGPTTTTATTADTGLRSDDAQRYSAWADRLRDKRTRDQATILGSPTDPVATGNWSSDSVRTGDDPVDEPGVVPDQRRLGRLLAELGLESGASAEQVAAAYRALAKVHHPDRWIEADETTQTHHVEQMVRLNAVYRALRTEL
jgi:DnaJ-domain-containing protein 1